MCQKYNISNHSHGMIQHWTMINNNNKTTIYKAQ